MRYLRSVVVFFFLLILFSSDLFIGPIFANNPPDQSHSSLSANSSVPADGQTQAVITVTLHDSSGNPVAGDSVTIADPNDNAASITTTSGTTDVIGRALFSIKSTTAGTDDLNVTDTTSNTTFTNLGQVTFTAPTPTPAGQCTDPAPGGTPQFTAEVQNGSNQIALTWTDASNPVSHYLLAYGTASGNYIYGNPNIGGQGTTTYTVGYLNPGTKYYFAIKAVNGCKPGSFSNEASATAGVTNTPTPEPTSIITASITPTPATSDGSDTGNQNSFYPSNSTDTTQDTPTPSSTIAPVPPANPGPSNSKVIEYIVVCALALAVFGGVLYWGYSKDTKKAEKLAEILPTEKDEKNLTEEIKPIQPEKKSG